jgi:hypothetical protein
MSARTVSGKFVRGEVSSADASAGVTATLYDATGTAYVLASTERIVIYDLLLVSAAGGNVALTVNTDSAGKRIVKATVAANGGIAMDYQRPVECPRGVVPKLFAAAGQVDLSFTAEIIDT